MIVMVFEFMVPKERMDEYLKESTEVRRHLPGIPGFISVERFTSASTPGRFVAIGYFQDETAVSRWRTLPEHRRVQAMGRAGLFSSYRLVMAEAVRDYTHDLRAQVPADSIVAHGN